MPKAQLFITRLGDQFYTSTLQNTTRILECLGVEMVFLPEQTCCGQPLFNNGFEDKTRPAARAANPITPIAQRPQGIAMIAVIIFWVWDPFEAKEVPVT